MIRYAIANPESALEVQKTLAAFFDQHPQGKTRVWESLTKDEKKIFKDLTTEPLDGMGKNISCGKRVQDLRQEKKRFGTVIGLEPKYRGSPKTPFIQWIANVQWDTTFNFKSTTELVSGDFLKVLFPFAHLYEIINSESEIQNLKDDDDDDDETLGSKLEETQNPKSDDDTTPSDPINIKALTIHQPWASLIGKHKCYETRSWKTNYRVKIAIHAAKRSPSCSPELLELTGNLTDLPTECVMAIAELTDCVEITREFISQQTKTELICGDWMPGRYAWKLENVQRLEKPIPANGKQGLSNWQPMVEEEVPIQRWFPQVGDRCENKNGCPLTIKEVRSNFGYVVVIYDDGDEARLGVLDVRPLQPEKDPKIIAKQLFDQIEIGDDLKALKHPDKKIIKI